MSHYQALFPNFTSNKYGTFYVYNILRWFPGVFIPDVSYRNECVFELLNIDTWFVMNKMLFLNVYF